MKGNFTAVDKFELKYTLLRNNLGIDEASMDD
jgi:hypothetical protein